MGKHDMTAQKILVLGPEGPSRAALESRLDRLGGDVLASEPASNGFVPAFGDVIFVDAREGRLDWTSATASLLDDSRPLVIVAEAPNDVVRALATRSAGAMVLTGAENDGGFRVALSLSAALGGCRRSHEETTGHRQRAGREWTVGASPAVAV
jgi:hypothetical protein